MVISLLYLNLWQYFKNFRDKMRTVLKFLCAHASRSHGLCPCVRYGIRLPDSFHSVRPEFRIFRTQTLLKFFSLGFGLVLEPLALSNSQSSLAKFRFAHSYRISPDKTDSGFAAERQFCRGCKSIGEADCNTR